MAILADKGKAAAAMHASIACMKMIMKTTSGSRSFSSAPVPVVLVAVMFFAASALGFGAALDGYSQLAYPVAVLGAVGMPHAAAFNVLGFVVPGLLLAVVAMTLYLRLPAGAGGSAHIGAWVLLFSTLAFAAQGVFPLDLDDLDATTGRLHVTTWSLWWLTTGAGVVLLASGLWRLHTRRRWAVLALVVAAAVPFFALFTPAAWGSAVPQRIAYAFWFGWWWLAARDLSRNAISAPGSSPPGQR